MRRTKQAALWTVMIVVVAVTVGCSVAPEPPEDKTLKEIKDDAVKCLETLEGQVAEDRAGVVQLQQFIGSIGMLRGYLKNLDLGTPQQQATFEEAIRSIRKRLSAVLPSASTMEAGNLKELLPRVREAIEAVPDSDQRPERGKK